MSAIYTPHTFRADLESGPLHLKLPQPLCHQDALADVFTVSLRRGNEPANLSGMAVYGYMTFHATHQSLPLSGEIAGNAASVTLTGDCYAFPGFFTLTIQLAKGDTRRTLAVIDGEIARTAADEVLSSGEVLPSLAELLVQVGDLQSATAEARAAAAAISGFAPAIRQEASGSAIAVPDAAGGSPLTLVTDISGDGGVSAVSIRRCGRNLLNTAALEPLQVNSTTVRNGMKFSAPGVYCLRANDPTAQSGYLYARHHDENGAAVGSTMYLVHSNSRSYTFTLESGYLYVWDANDRTMAKSAAFMTAVQAQVEFDAFSDYEPYQEQVLTAELPQAVGAGTLDWSTGTLTITTDADGTALSEPVIHQLEAQSLELLAGRNFITTTGGTTHIAYAADTKTYIDNAIAAIAASVLNA